MAIDREKICPFLIRCFWSTSRPYSSLDYDTRKGKLPQNEVQIYTWKDANILEITELLKEAIPATCQKNITISYAFVYPDRTGNNVVKPVSITLKK